MAATGTNRAKLPMSAIFILTENFFMDSRSNLDYLLGRGASRLWWILMWKGLWSGYQSELFYSVETQVSVSESSEYLSVFFGRFSDQFICKGFQSDTL